MWRLAEISKHNGLVELEAAGALMLVDEAPGTSGQEEGHCGGGGEEKSERLFTDEEIMALRWKSGLPKWSPEAVTNVLRELPEWCVQRTVEEYRQRPATAVAVTKPTFLCSRDALLSEKRKAAHHFVEFFKAKNGGELDPRKFEVLERGQAPYGWFGSFCKTNPKDLPQFNNVSDRNRYVRVLKLYQRAVKEYFQSGAAVVAGRQYYSTQSYVGCVRE